VLKTCSNIITNILNKEPEQHVGDILTNRLREVKGDLEYMTDLAWVYKEEQGEKPQSRAKRRKVKAIFTVI